jgi:hypothetical protein
MEAMQDRLDRQPHVMRVRRQTAEHPFGTLKLWMLPYRVGLLRAALWARARRAARSPQL